MRVVAMSVVSAALLALVGTARADDDLIKRGQYLATAGDCIACHTVPGGTPYAGGRKMDTPFGAIYPPNLTPDKATGIGDWTDDEFYRAVHEGIGKKGEYLYPVFPFPWYTNVSRDDVLAIKAYLFSQPAVHADNKPPAFPFPFNIRTALLTWRTLFFKVGKPIDQPPGDKVARGQYLVEGLGHCGECHNHNAVMGASDWSGKYEGGEIQGWYAPNLTSDGKQGVGAWSEQEIADYLKTGVSATHGVALGPMIETINDSLMHLTDDDRRAMAAYLKSIKPKEKFANNGYTGKRAPGEEVYLDHCASCHGVEGKGVAGEVPALAKNGAVLAQGPEDVIRVVVGGLIPAHGYGPMPAVGQSMTEDEISRVADYVRNAFGNAAPATSKPTLIAKLRKETPTPMAPQSAVDCGEPGSPEIKTLVDNGALATFMDAKPVDRVQAMDDLVDKLKPAASSGKFDILADLTSAYCRVVISKTTGPAAARQIGDFAVLAYSRAKSRMTLGDAK